MVDYLSGPVVHDAFFRKYASKKFLKGKLVVFYAYATDMLTCHAASIVLRNWAKKWAPKYLDGAEVEAGGDTPVL